ncbi:MAG: metallophosphoesterase [Fibromonadales bacterium]|nr:metallophosphoesterase [Fibromonadales bacterium]
MFKKFFLLSALVAFFAASCAPVNNPVLIDEAVQFDAEMLALTPGQNTDKLNLAWYSDADGAKSVVRLFMESGELVKTEAGTSGEASAGKLWHKATLTDLVPGTSYKYSVSNDSIGWSKKYDYPAPAAGAFRFAMVGDPQLSAGESNLTAKFWKESVEKIAESGASFILSAGDHVDNSGGDEAEYANLFTPLALRSIPIAPAKGNHDAHNLFEYHFNLPNELREASANYFYLRNNVLFIALNTSVYPDGKEKAEEYVAEFDDVIRAAKAANAGKYDFVVVQHHKSTRSVASHVADADIELYVEAGFERLMAEHGVDLVVAGHDHIYVRSLVEGIVYLTLSTASGSKFYQPSENADISSPIKYSQREIPEYTIVDVDGKSMTVKTYGLDGQLIDEFSLFSKKI